MLKLLAFGMEEELDSRKVFHPEVADGEDSAKEVPTGRRHGGLCSVTPDLYLPARTEVTHTSRECGESKLGKKKQDRNRGHRRRGPSADLF